MEGVLDDRELNNSNYLMNPNNIVALLPDTYTNNSSARSLAKESGYEKGVGVTSVTSQFIPKKEKQNKLRRKHSRKHKKTNTKNHTKTHKKAHKRKKSSKWSQRRGKKRK
jgi:hypothetical protein